MKQPTKIADPFTLFDPGDETPRGAVIEIVERHTGRKRSYTGVESIIVPNLMRINEIAVWSSYDAPATLCETVIDGTCATAVTIRVMARALNVGAAPAFLAAAEAGRGNVNSVSAVVVEVPDVGNWVPGDQFQRRWVLLNGHRVWTVGDLTVDRMAVHGEDRNVAMVTMTLLCRQLLVDDEPEPAAARKLPAAMAGFWNRSRLVRHLAGRRR